MGCHLCCAAQCTAVSKGYEKNVVCRAAQQSAYSCWIVSALFHHRTVTKVHCASDQSFQGSSATDQVFQNNAYTPQVIYCLFLLLNLFFIAQDKTQPHLMFLRISAAHVVSKQPPPISQHLRMLQLQNPSMNILFFR